MSRFTRRQLLEDSLLAAAAMAVGGCSMSGGSAAPAPVSTGRKIGPNDQIRIAQIGFHGQGGSHINAYLGMKDVVIATLCDIDTDVWKSGLKAIEAKGKPKPECVQDLRRVLDDKSIDAVSIATPNHWHALAAIWAMQAGKDVYVEKPVCHNVSEGRRMVEAARKYGRICQSGTQCRSMKGTIDAIQYIRDGKIGEVKLVRGLCYKNRDSIGIADGTQAPPKSADYDIWVGPAPMKALGRKQFHYDWHWFWDYGNGDLGNQGIHQMDIARWALNKNTLPKSVLSLGGRFGYKDDGQTPNTELCFFDYGDCELIFEVRGLHKETPNYRGARVGNVFHGSEGYVVLTSYTAGAAFDKDGKKVATFTGGGDHHGNFIKAMRSRQYTDLHADVLEGHLSSSLCHLANISYRTGQEAPFNAKSNAFGDDKEAAETFARMQEHLKANEVPMDGATYHLGKKPAFDAKSEKFTNDSKANALLTREYRKPFVVPKHV